MEAKNIGALPLQAIRELILQKHILGADDKHAQPASLDLTLSDEVYRVDGLFLPKTGERVRDAILKVNPIAFAENSIFEVGVPYLARLNEKLKLPADVYAYSNPKSSTGRNDVKVSLIVDGISRFDSAGARGYSGELWAFIEPKSFRIKLPKNEALLQLRFFNDDTRVKEEELRNIYEKDALLFRKNGDMLAFDELKISDRDGGLILTVDFGEEIIGWRAKNGAAILDFAKRAYYNATDFFEPVSRPVRDFLFLQKGNFYIFYTREYVRVPANLACEMAPVDIKNGEFRSHYAGFIDPGWGGKTGLPLVLEVRPFDDNILVSHGQPICKLVFERMAETPDRLYGEGSGSHYTLQRGPVLSKHFKKHDF